VRGGLRIVFLAVPVLWVAAAHIGPLVAMARISILDVYPGPPDVAPGFGLAAYAAFLHEAGYRASLLRSLGLAAAATAASLLLSYPLAYHVAVRVAPKQRQRRLMLLVAPFWTSEVLRMFALVLLLANRGALNAVLRWLGVTSAPVPLLYGTGTVLAGLVYTVLLSMLLPLYAALDRLPANLLAAASTLGAGAWRRFWHVTLPLTARGIATGSVLTFLASLGIFAAPALLGGPSTPVFATTIADLFGAASGRWPIGAAFGFILLTVGTACAAGLAALPGLMVSRYSRPARPS
jgi:spermidine/putrescine transport system permease protein